jgi:hypothetical protein
MKSSRWKAVNSLASDRSRRAPATMTQAAHPALAGPDLERALELTHRAADAVQTDAIGYTLIIAVPHPRPWATGVGVLRHRLTR